MVRKFCYTVALLLLAACGSSKTAMRDALATVDVQVPVAQARAVPPELLQPVLGGIALPYFVAPSDAKATSALTPEGEQQLRALIATLLLRIRGWEAYAND